jgi:hypothetical protein
LDQKSTAELLEFWKSGCTAGWTGTAFDIVGEILQKRLGKNLLQRPSAVPATRATKIPWLMITVGIGVVLILAAVVFSPLFTKPAAPVPPTPSLPSTSTPTAILTDTPTSTLVITPAATVPSGLSRPVSGVIMPNKSVGGHGELTVENGTTQDGVVILTLNNASIMAAYIRTGDSFTMTGIRDGIYYLYFSTGTDWNGKAFTNNSIHKKFDDSFEFTTGPTTYTTWSVTLQGVVGGTASASNVDASTFPSIGN